jgi:orotate phosphoribosyltransferase
MANSGHELLLPEEEQLELGRYLADEGLFGIIESGTFTELKSKRLSPHYLDVRPGISSHRTREIIGASMASLAMLRIERMGHGTAVGDAYEHVVGTPQSMTSYMPKIADNLNHSNLLQPRVDTHKTSGNKTPILGRFKPGDYAAAFDDVVTDGLTKIENIGTLQENGLVVMDYFVLLDREEGGVPEVVQATKVQITPALGISSLARLLRAEGEISVRQFDNVAGYLEQYGEPHAKETINTPI